MGLKRFFVVVMKIELEDEATRGGETNPFNLKTFFCARFSMVFRESNFC